MQVALLSIVLLLGVVTANALVCPDGSEIYALGIYGSQQQDILREHNKYRRMVLNGDVQPRAKIMPDLKWDNALSAAAQVVSLSCEMTHNIKKDPRFGVGQNLHISWSSSKDTNPDWAKAVKKWFDEHDKFTYPYTNDDTLHYTQLVWAKTTLVGCQFIAFYDKKMEAKNMPYAKLYSCNYGPAGNIEGQAPYEKA